MANPFENISETEAKALKEMLSQKANELKEKEELEKASNEIMEYSKVEPAVKQMVDLGYHKKVLEAYPELAAISSDSARFRKVFLSRAKEILEGEKKSVESAAKPEAKPAVPAVNVDKVVTPTPNLSGDISDDTIVNPDDPEFHKLMEKAGVPRDKILLFKMFNNVGKRNVRLGANRENS